MASTCGTNDTFGIGMLLPNKIGEGSYYEFVRLTISIFNQLGGLTLINY